MTHTLSSQIAAVRRMASLDVIRKLTTRASEQDLLLAQLRAARACSRGSVMEKPKLTHYERLLLAKIGSGMLCCECDDTQAGIDSGGFRYWIEPGGKSARPASAKGLIDKGLLAPLPSALFADAQAQQWRVAA